MHLLLNRPWSLSSSDTMKLLSKARRPAIIGRDRRPAMTPNEFLAEMPLQLRHIHYLGGGLSTNAPTPTKHDKTSEGGYVVVKPTRQRGHRHQHAIVWDDLASIIRLEVMSAEQKLNCTSSKCCQQQTIAPSSTSSIERPLYPGSNINKTISIQKKSSKCSRGSAHRMWEQAEEYAMAAASASSFASWNNTEVVMDQRDDVAAAREGNEQGSSRDIATPHSISTAVTPPDECAVSSPPKVKRMAAFCFDASSNGCEQGPKPLGGYCKVFLLHPSSAASHHSASVILFLWDTTRHNSTARRRVHSSVVIPTFPAMTKKKMTATIRLLSSIVLMMTILMLSSVPLLPLPPFQYQRL